MNFAIDSSTAMERRSLFLLDRVRAQIVQFFSPGDKLAGNPLRAAGPEINLPPHHPFEGGY